MVDWLNEGPLGQMDWFGNSPAQWLGAALIVIGAALVGRIATGWLAGRIRRLAQKTTTRFDDAWVQVIDATKWTSYLAVGIAGARPIVELPERVDDALDVGLLVFLALQFVFWLQAALNALLELWADRDASGQASTATAAVRFIGRLVIWSAFVLVVLSNLGVELTSIVAGLGVGGVAAALAVQSILSDLFAGLSMYFDRPFDIGDFIIVGPVLGTVMKIGLRTTRIASLGGEQIIYPNGVLVKEVIRNYTRMEERRVVWSFGIEYGSGADKIERARDIAEAIIQEKDGVRFDRAHFKQYGAYSLDYEVVHYVTSPDYNLFMQLQHEINLELYRRFEAEDIPFAFPTRTVHLHQESSVSSTPQN